MLVLSRKTRQQIQIGDNVVVTILLVKGNTVRVGIEAPRNVRVLRAELPLHEQTQAAEEKPLQICIETSGASVVEDREPSVPQPAKKSHSSLTSTQRADRAQRTGPVLEALRRRGGLGALSRSQSPTPADGTDLSPIFDHH